MKFQPSGTLLLLAIIISGLLSIEYALADQQMTEAEFNSSIDKVEVLYSPIVENLGKRLLIDREWTNDSNVAMAMKGFYITIPGGLARVEGMTTDGLMLFVCHELGHYLGGAPKHSHPNLKWSSVEGQADYWATAKCLKKVFESDDNEAILKSKNVPLVLSQKCEQAHRQRKDIAICIRSSLAGMSAINVMPGRSNVSINTPDPLIVPVLNESYGTTQCRLDTYLQGSLCNRPFHEDVDQTNELAGVCNATQNTNVGARPLCWYKSGL